MTRRRTGPLRTAHLVGAAIAWLLLPACREHAAVAPPLARSPFARADSLRLLGRNDSAVVRYGRLGDSLRAAGDSTGVWTATLWKGYGLMRLGQRDSAGVFIREALHRALLAQDSTKEAWSRSILSNWWDQQGRFDSALTHAARARELARSSTNPTLGHSTAVSLGRIYVRVGRDRESLALHESTLVADRKLAPQHGDLVASDLNETCIDCERLGDLTESAARCEEEMELARRIDDHDELSRLRLNRGVAYADVGDQARAESLYHAALIVDAGHKNARGLAITHGDLGNVYLAAHNDSLARREYTTADSIARRAGLVWNTLTTYLDLANVALDEGQPDTAARMPGASSSPGTTDC